MRKLISGLIAATMALVIPQLASAQTSTLREVLDRGKLIVGVPVDQAPFGYFDEAGKPIGFDIDLAKLMAEQLGVDLEMKPMTRFC